MKTSVLSMVAKGLCVGVLATFLVSCGEKTQSLTPNKDEPKWVNNISEAKERAKSNAVAVGSAKVLDGNINFATNQATMQARIQIAQMISTKVEQAIKELAQSDGLKISENSIQAAKQKVEQTLQKTEMVERWIDKDSKPNVLYVLVGMDKDAFDNAMKGGAQVLNINSSQALELSNTVEALLK
ncbi:hypothetical protein DCO58_05500 [Helicobacter saguini]|uniref:Lipoprotein LPP20-like domain-containing protein n=1 Tax=Helicobacter saguini TaxID=1548018 RepID=A0A347VT89_9HELI|nr:LPP20 family lipoprotein [Helicobacter saguini]MWV62194.1 hypothetical protein [Helicobacter saguini]MWV67132.1 hypothetical protein [Helicobacter saguini]MWV69483.1 hypothetical protein [Helicobacter saguini]MWV70965.1 hypothetical protein [Helicobacter saguini]TLD92948.1 hypothetical protein LS64_009680 [Helicobacter saguini]